jgi:hypothetical protein
VNQAIGKTLIATPESVGESLSVNLPLFGDSLILLSIFFPVLSMADGLQSYVCISFAIPPSFLTSDDKRIEKKSKLKIVPKKLIYIFFY